VQTEGKMRRLNWYLERLKMSKFV